MFKSLETKTVPGKPGRKEFIRYDNPNLALLLLHLRPNLCRDVYCISQYHDHRQCGAKVQDAAHILERGSVVNWRQASPTLACMTTVATLSHLTKECWLHLSTTKYDLMEITVRYFSDRVLEEKMNTTSKSCLLAKHGYFLETSRNWEMNK